MAYRWSRRVVTAGLEMGSIGDKVSEIQPPPDQHCQCSSPEKEDPGVGELVPVTHSSLLKPQPCPFGCETLEGVLSYLLWFLIPHPSPLRWQDYYKDQS